MDGSRMYHEGHRRMQDLFDSRRIADRLEEVTVHEAFTEDDRAFVESAPFFFLATCDAEGRPECSYKGGVPGFVRVTGPSELAFPSYDGNGMFRSLGNVLVNPNVQLLFIDFQEPSRMRVSGTARVVPDDPLRAQMPGADAVVRVQATLIFPNCPRYIHRMGLEEVSPYAPREGHRPPIPGWKRAPAFNDALPARDPARRR